MSHSPDKIEFKMLDFERLENDFVSFKLEDGTIMHAKPPSYSINCREGLTAPLHYVPACSKSCIFPGKEKPSDIIILPRTLSGLEASLSCDLSKRLSISLE